MLISPHIDKTGEIQDVNDVIFVIVEVATGKTNTDKQPVVAYHLNITKAD